MPDPNRTGATSQLTKSKALLDSKAVEEVNGLKTQCDKDGNRLSIGPPLMSHGDRTSGGSWKVVGLTLDRPNTTALVGWIDQTRRVPAG